MIGFDIQFIQGFDINLPMLSSQLRKVAFNDGKPIHHTRFSIIFNQERGFAIATAHNIDGRTMIPKGVIKRSNNFRFDPDVPNGIQIDNEQGYADLRVQGEVIIHNPWDRGHLVRRRSLQWGDVTTATEADRESFYWTNIVPQHERLHDTAWGKIEDWMLEYADESDKRVSVFTGPILRENDFEHRNRPDEDFVKIPAGFWKILAVKRKGELCAAAFILLQNDFAQPNPVEFDPVLEQVRVSFVELVTGLSFGNLKGADPLRFGSTPETVMIGEDLRTELLASRAATVKSINDIVLDL